jgi:acetyltransferase-like isoleucine patch superfamily enzyme
VEVAPGAWLEIGEDVAIGERCRILVRGGTLRIGPRTVVGERCRLIAHAGIELGADVVLGDEVVVIDFDHRYDDVELPVRRQGLVAEPVRIGDGARVGPRAAIQRGVTIGERAEVGPLSVVTGAMSGGERVAGVPALSPSAGRETRGGSRSRRGR